MSLDLNEVGDAIQRYGLPLTMLVLFIYGGAKSIIVFGRELSQLRVDFTARLAEQKEFYEARLADSVQRYTDEREARKESDGRVAAILPLVQSVADNVSGLVEALDGKPSRR